MLETSVFFASVVGEKRRCESPARSSGGTSSANLRPSVACSVRDGERTLSATEARARLIDSINEELRPSAVLPR